MNKIVLSFPTIVELIDFEMDLETPVYEIDRKALTIMGNFTRREIEVALHMYFAKFQEMTEY